MDNIKNILLGVVIVGLVLVGWKAFNPPKLSHDDVVNSVISAINSNFGALVGPDIPYNWFSFGRVREWAYRSSILPGGNASTTVCSFRSPDATTTLAHASIYIASTTPLTTSVDIGYSQGLASSTNQTVTPAVPTATTTNLARLILTGGGPVSLMATSSIGIGINSTTTAPGSLLAIAENLIYPRSFINFKVGDNASSTRTDWNTTGTCQVKFLEL